MELGPTVPETAAAARRRGAGSSASSSPPGPASSPCILLAAALIGISLYRIDHAVHHVGGAGLALAQGKNDLLAIVKGPDHSEQVFVFHAIDGHTHVLKIPSALALPLPDGGTVPLETLSLHAPVRHHRRARPPRHPGQPLRRRRPAHGDPSSSLGQLATGKLSVTSLISNPTGTSVAARAGGLAHVSRARDPGLGRALPDERAHGQPRLRPDRHGRCTATSCSPSAFATVLRGFL